MPDRAVTRRRLLGAASTALSAAVAGCGGSGGGTTTTATTDTTAVTTATTATTTATTTRPTTPAPPNAEKRIFQRDRAAITHVNAVVTGTITWPSVAFVDPTEVVGVWELIDGEEVVTLNPDGTFSIRTPEQSVSGVYAVRQGGRLDLESQSGNSVTYQYSRSEADGEARLEIRQDGELVGRYVRTGGGPDVSDPVDAVKALEVRREEGPAATTESQDLRTGATGSGFLVHPDGYLVTNAHVVLGDRDPETLLYEELGRVTARELRSALQEEFADSDLTDREKAEIEGVMFEKLAAYFGEYSRVEGVSESVNVLNGRATPDDDIAVESWDATVETQGTVVTEVNGQPSWGRDIAVLDVEAENLPSVTLGDSTGLTTGDELIVVGYPDIGVGSLFEEREQVLQPTLTTGVVSARRTLNSGVETIQTDAAINSGNSGGPMYNTDGEVVGVATFGPANVGIEQVGFGLPVEIAKGFLTELGVENVSGEMDTAFDEGLAAYWRGDCETATERFRTALDRYPEHPYAEQYIADCESGDAPGQ